MALVISLQLCLSCQPRNGLVQEIQPAESAVVDILHAKTARIRSLYCDIMVEPVDAARWSQLMKAAVYRKPGQRPLIRRTPPVSAFLVIMKNTVNAPVQLEKIQILYGDASVDALTVDRITTRLNSPSYSGCNFSRMLSFRRLVREPESMNKIDFDSDTIETKLDFVPPRDFVIKVVAFETIPVEIRRFKLRFSIAAMGSKKDIAIEFTRNEYRAGGKKKIEESANDDE